MLNFFFHSYRHAKCRHDKKPSRASSWRGCGRVKRDGREEGMYDGFHKLSIGRTNNGGGKHPVVSMTTEPAPCELDVYLNARELRDVIFAPLLCRPLLVSHHAACPFFVEGALGDNVILSSSPRYILLLALSRSHHSFPCRGMAAQTSSLTNNVSSLAVR